MTIFFIIPTCIMRLGASGGQIKGLVIIGGLPPPLAWLDGCQACSHRWWGKLCAELRQVSRLPLSFQASDPGPPETGAPSLQPPALTTPHSCCAPHPGLGLSTPHHSPLESVRQQGRVGPVLWALLPLLLSAPHSSR